MVSGPNAGKYGPEKNPYLNTFHAADCDLNMIFTLEARLLIYKLFLSKNISLALLGLRRKDIERYFLKLILCDLSSLDYTR